MFDRRFVVTLLLGQLISLSNSLAGIFTTLLQEQHGLNLPDIQNLAVYLSILAVAFPLALNSKAGLLDNVGMYFVASSLDYGANFLVLFSFSHLELLRIILLLCLSTPVVMVLSIIFFKTRYRGIHYLGVAIVLVGVLMLSIDRSDGSLWGHLVCGASAMLFGLSNVSQEHLVRKNGSLRYLAMLGFFGTVLTLLKTILVPASLDNLYRLVKLDFSIQVLFLVLGYASCMLAFYGLSPILFGLSNATFFNISLLTTNVYSLLFSLLFHPVSWEYLLSLVTVLSGLAIFNLFPIDKVY